jgi:hypothetical protein
VPEKASLEYWPKIGWGWELCIDGPQGSALLSWSNGSGPFTKLRPASCKDAAHDRRDFLRVEGSGRRVEFLFPESPDDFGLGSDQRACPHSVPPEALAEFRSTLEAARMSPALTPEAAAATDRLIETLQSVRTEDLQLSGGIGNADSWSVLCTPASR